MVRLPIYPPISVYPTCWPVTLGIVICLFFRCVGALLYPAHERGGVRWGFMVYTITAFTLVTIFTAMNPSLRSTCYIDNRLGEFPGNDSLPAGPLGYHFLRSQPYVPLEQLASRRCFGE